MKAIRKIISKKKEPKEPSGSGKPKDPNDPTEFQTTLSASGFNEWTLENTNRLTMNGHTKLCKCVDVLDGDTCTVIVFLDDEHRKPYYDNCRMLGYDSPEIHTTDLSEKEQGFVSKKALEHLILGKLVLVRFGDPSKSYKDDKFGRLLATIFVPLEDPKDQNDPKENFPILVADECKDRTCTYLNGLMVPDTVSIGDESLNDHKIHPDVKLLNVNDWMLNNTDSVSYQGEKKVKYKDRKHKCLGELSEEDYQNLVNPKKKRTSKKKN